MRRSFPAAFYRGGTSKGLFFTQQHLPLDRAEWTAIFAAALGSAEGGGQLDGLGGGAALLSKIGVVGPASVPDADVDYTFGQVAVDRAHVDYRSNCGNLLAAVGPFAVEAGFLKPPDGEARVRIHVVNTGKRVHAHFAVKDGTAVEKGRQVIPGVPGTGAPIRLDFLTPAGIATGKLLPTGNAQDTLSPPAVHGSPVTATLIDAGSPCVLLRAADFGLTGTEAPQAIERDVKLMVRLQTLRAHASVAMGLAPDVAAARKLAAVPSLVLVGKPADDAAHLAARVLSQGQMHRTLPLTVALCLAAAARIPGSVAEEIGGTHAGPTRIDTPEGVLTADAEVTGKGAGLQVPRASFYRTARRLMDGRVHA